MPIHTLGERLSTRLRITAAMAAMLLIAACSSDAPVEAFRNGDYGASFRSFSQAAKNGDRDAQNWTGVHYYLGLGVARDYTESFSWFERAALAEHAGAQHNLGLHYLHGLGVEKDLLASYGWFFEALRGGKQTSGEFLKTLGDNVTPNQTLKAREMVRDRLNEAAAAQ